MSLAQSLNELRSVLARVDLPFTIEGAEAARIDRQELVDQLDDYLLPRLARIDAPLLVVLGGSTGAGKSTITNSLVGADVTESGVLRPTTRTPVLACNPLDLSWFRDGGVLPELPRSSGVRPTGAGLHLMPTDTLPPGLAVLDSPDIDSVEVANHGLAAQLLGAADMWLFVTTAARYADAVPWDYLARARERSAAVALIINRVPDSAIHEVTDHLRQMITERDMELSNLFAVPECDLLDGRIGPQLEPVREWLHALAADAEQRRAVIMTSVGGAVASIPERSERIALALDDQTHVSTGLVALVDQRYGEARREISQQLATGQILRGEVLGQWQSIVGTGEVMSRLQQGVGRVRDGIRNLFSGGTADDAELQGELRSNVAVVVRAAADTAALETVEGWEALPGGREALDPAERGIDRGSPSLEARVESEVEQWQHGVFELVRELAGPKLNLARTLTFGINSVGLAAMFAVFSSTGGITGGEAAIAGGTAAISQTILSAVFGEQAIRDLVDLARDDLQKRLSGVLDHDESRFAALVAEHDLTALADELRSRAAAVAAAAPPHDAP